MMNIGHASLLLWDICHMSLAFEIREKDSGNLGWLVETFLESFIELYSSKLHCFFKIDFVLQMILLLRQKCIA